MTTVGPRCVPAQLTHLVEAAYPISGSVRPVDWAPTHATALLLNTVFHNLPIE